MALFLVGVFVSINGIRLNHQVMVQKKRLESQNNTGVTNSTAPSTAKPSISSINNYLVAPNLPRYIDITKLGVHARVLSMGVNADDQLQSPGSVYDTGWYNASAQPGQPGGMLIDGHISSWTTHGVFYGLNKLVVGDTISITRGDSKTFIYKVVKSQAVAVGNVDMACSAPGR